MKILPRFSSIIVGLSASWLMLVCIALSPAISASIETPANQALALTLIGRGVQIYKCSAVPGIPNKFEWVLKGPEADLFDADGRKVGRHFAGPTWELNDGGKVIGRVKAKADAPDGKSIPWLLLDAVQASGTIMGKVLSIQRIDTVGGKVPSEPADVTNLGQEKKVEYNATYKFYVAKS
jgi:hypothetical protein